MAYEALRDYLKNSELRIADKNLYFRMSPELAQRYDAGVYDLAVSEQVGCIYELMSLQLLPNNDKKFYVYLVPDERFVELLLYPYKDKEQGGRPVQCFDKDGLNIAYGSSQNLFILEKASGRLSHVMDLHEYAHLIQYEFECKDLLFNEGFAELVPWYLLGYENRTQSHINAVLNTDIYTAGQILGIPDVFSDVVENRPASFQKSYISSYIFIRTIIEKIEEKYNLDKVSAAKLWLKRIQETRKNRGWLVKELAEKLGLDADKLLNTTEYQKEVLQKMKTTGKINTPPREIIR
ncbi:MAG: hypothetical protein J6Y07_03375 [Alphaproteobacteria bacterium]|nr:hypothetical protein [Alphaproteobacteria bacterium]